MNWVVQTYVTTKNVKHIATINQDGYKNFFITVLIMKALFVYLKGKKHRAKKSLTD